MENWYDNNLSAVSEYPFDFDRYIRERLREIGDLDERRFAKEVLLNGLGKVIQCMEQKYQNLEKRIYEEIEIAASQYETVMTIVEREHFDPVNQTLFPVEEWDLDDMALAEALSDGERIFLGTIFLEADDGRQEKFRKTGVFPGYLREKETEFFVYPAKRYQKAVEDLYQIFQDNHIPWRTIHTGYLDKFYDIYVKAENTADTESKKDLPSWKDAVIRFGEYEGLIRMNKIPLWNIQRLTFDSANFMLPCTDGITYEHEFSLAERDRQGGYLIQCNEDILEIRHEKEKIRIRSSKEIFTGWKALYLNQYPTVRSLDYDAPLLTNHRKDSFIRRYAQKNGRRLMTKSDLFRRIMELDIREFIEITGYEICSATERYPMVPGMDWFVRDELFPLDSRRVLLLKFEEKQPGHYLNGSMVRFAVSQIQSEISEYRCVGVMG